MADNISKYNSTQTSAERSENARRAGIASGAARRQRAEILRLFRNPLYRQYIEEADMDAIADALIHSALRGNISAFRLIIDILDEDNEPDIDDVILVLDEDTIK